MTLLYFAWIRSGLGIDREQITPPSEITTVSELLDWLTGRSPEFADVLKSRSAIRVAVNQEFASPSTPIQSGDEIALFPPITGG